MATNARFQSLTTARFLSADPIWSVGFDRRPLNVATWNRYAYVLNNPLRYIDPNGLQEVDAVVSGFEKQLELIKDYVISRLEKIHGGRVGGSGAMGSVAGLAATAIEGLKVLTDASVLRIAENIRMEASNVAASDSDALMIEYAAKDVQFVWEHDRHKAYVMLMKLLEALCQCEESDVREQSSNETTDEEAEETGNVDPGTEVVHRGVRSVGGVGGDALKAREYLENRSK